MSAPTLPNERDQIVTLSRTFLARFFDNDITGGSTDLRHAFLWLIAAIAMPGVLVPQSQIGRWMGIMFKRGPEALRMESAVDKVFALGTTMVIVGLLAAIVWQSLLIDRRDVLVLGSVPLRHRTLLAGKFGALVGFFGIITLALHAVGSVLYGMYLGTQTGLLFGLWMIVAFFVAATAAGLFTYLTVIASQGLLLGIAGPRQFARLAPLLQLVIITSAILLFAMLPLTAGATPGPVYGLPSRSMPGLFWMPPVWFFGLYETIQGTSNAVLHDLAGRAILALAAVGTIALVSYPLAYRRVVTDALVGAPVSARRGIVRRCVARLPALLARNHIAQATLQFAISTVGRTSMHRLVLAVAVGAGAAFVIPVVSVNLSTSLAAPTPGLLSVPILLMLFLLVALRIATAIPAELSAAWIFAASSVPSTLWFRIAMRRFLWIAGVLPPAAITFVVFWAVWDLSIAWSHLLVCAAVGALVVELLLIGFEGVPCAKAYTPGAARLQSRWPWYLLLVVTFNIHVPQLEARLLDAPQSVAILAGSIAFIAVAIRLWADREWRRRGGIDTSTDELTVIELN